MEFGVMSSNGVVVSGNGYSSFSLDDAAKRKWCGSADDFEDCNKPTNFAKLNHDSSFVFSDNQQEQNMLSFSSSPKLDAYSPKYNGAFENKNFLQNPTSFTYSQHSNSLYSKNAGYSCHGNPPNASMYSTNGVKGPFTTSQWFELEQQALIYKYMLANEPVPPSLLTSIRRAFESAARFSSFPPGLLRPNMFGWGPIHLGFASSTDPEVGRCRRTDGKKWRCSRDAVPDQKYCERHINRGRHRSRKPVEGQTGHSVTGATTNKISNTITTTNLMNTGSSSSASVVPGGAGPSNGAAAINLHQSKDLLLQPVHSNHMPSSLVHRFMANKTNSNQGMQSTTGLDFLSPKTSLNSIAESIAGDIPYITSDAILSTTQRGASVSRTCAQSHDPNAQHSSSPLMEDPSSIFWPKLEEQTNRTTKLTISIPPADFMSSTSSPTGETVALSPLRLSRELDSSQVCMDTSMVGMSLGLETVSNNQSLNSWESSMGGPLGEVLKTTTSNSSGGQSKSISALNLLSKGSVGSPQLASSPTGVLQRTLGYFSNSSAGSSPRAENGKALNSGTANGDRIGFTQGSSSSLPL